MNTAENTESCAALKINYIEFPAGNFDLIQRFYEKAFGWRFTDYGPDYRAFNDGNLEGGFYHSAKQSTPESGAALIILYSDDLAASIDCVKKAGGQIMMEIFDFPGGRRFQFADPHGNQLAVWSDK